MIVPDEGDPWEQRILCAAQEFMAQLQENLRFCEVVGEGDPDFVTALRRVGADLAWAFHERFDQDPTRARRPT